MSKLQYNQLLQRYIKAEVYMSRDDISLEKKEKFLPELQRIQSDLSVLLDDIKNYTRHEALNGFNVEGDNL